MHMEIENFQVIAWIPCTVEEVNSKGQNRDDNGYNNTARVKGKLLTLGVTSGPSDFVLCTYSNCCLSKRICFACSIICLLKGWSMSLSQPIADGRGLGCHVK